MTEKKAKLKYSLFILNDVNVVFTIFDQDDRFLGTQKNAIRYLCLNGWCVASRCRPQISISSRPIVYLRGIELDRNNSVTVVTCRTVEEAQEVVKNVHCALKEWANKWPGWREVKAEYQSANGELPPTVFTI
jgi:hypothetical protein